MRKIFLFMMVGLFTVGVAIAQDKDCPGLVDQALAVVGNACEGLGRNQVCYGNVKTEAQGQNGEALTFNVAGDKVSVSDVASLTTFPLNPDDKTWGIAVMALQANLPDTLPGQNVTFVVFGNVGLENTVKPDLARLPATAKSNGNIRTGPGTKYNRGGTLKKGDTITVVGQVKTGSWLQILYGDDQSSGWVSASLLDVQGDLSTLNVAEEGPAYLSPMQAFRIHTTAENTSCDKAPPDGVLVQAPEGVKVNFLVNDVQITLGSTALIRGLDGNTIRVINLSGHVSVRTAGVTLDLAPGESIDVTAGTAPGRPGTYQQEDAQLLPLKLLPVQPSVPPVITGVLTSTIPGDGQGHAIPISFVNADGDPIVILHQKFISSTAGSAPSGDQPVTPADYDNPYGGTLGYAFGCVTTGTISVTYQISIEDAAGNVSPPVRYTITCTPP